MTGDPIRFGTDGWRAGIADEYTFANLRLVAQGFAHFVRREWSWQNGIVVGYDRRFASPEFARTDSRCSGRQRHPRFSRRPALPHARGGIQHRPRIGAAGAVMITASHNPPSDNGFKIRTASGAALPPASLEKVEAAIAARHARGHPPARRRIRRAKSRSFDPRVRLSQARAKPARPARDCGSGTSVVVVDAMYGSGAGWLPRFLERRQASRSSEIHPEWNPAFPGLARPEPIPPQTDALGAAVRDAQAAVGLAVDGDADRLGVVDEHGALRRPAPHHRPVGLLHGWSIATTGGRW